MRAVSSTERSSRSHPATSESEWWGTTARRSVGDSASVLSLSCTYQYSERQGKKKRSQPSLNPFSLPHIIWLYSCLSLLHCHLSYNLKGSQMPSHFSPWSCQVGSPKVLVTNVSPQPLKSKGPRGFFKQARLSGWQLAQLRPVTLIQHLARR